MLYARYMYPDNGQQHQRDHIATLGLVVGNRYLVEDVSMGQSYTGIKLDGYDRYLNSVFFDFEEDDYTTIDIYRDPRFNPYIKRR